MDKTTEERIKADALYHTKYGQPKFKTITETRFASYIAGATAENERAQKAIDILEEAYNSHIEEKRLLVERYPHLFPNIDNYVKPWVAKAKEFLQQWKGTGKEETKPTKIETCGHCGNHPANNYIGSQLYLCDECMEKHTEDCY